MPSSASSSAQAARQALADQLREIRERAGLTARALAAAAGWRPQKISRIEHGVRPISATDLVTWCRLCDVPAGWVEGLLAERSAAAGMWTTMQRLHRAGLKQAQESVRAENEEVRLYRCYQPMVVPGLLQTVEYTTAALESVRELLGLSGDDIVDAVAERMARQQVLRRPDARWVFVLEEQLLRYRVCDRDAHLEQLAHLGRMMAYPSVSLGIIPLDADRPLRWPCEGFTMMDADNWRKVVVELVSGYLQISTPSELALYRTEFDALAGIAVHGRAARALLRRAVDGDAGERSQGRGNLRHSCGSCRCRTRSVPSHERRGLYADATVTVCAAVVPGRRPAACAGRRAAERRRRPARRGDHRDGRRRDRGRDPGRPRRRGAEAPHPGAAPERGTVAVVQGDLVARLRWLAEHDRAALVELLVTVEPQLLGLARRLVVRDVGPERPRLVQVSRQG